MPFPALPTASPAYSPPRFTRLACHRQNRRNGVYVSGIRTTMRPHQSVGVLALGAAAVTAATPTTAPLRPSTG
jgi:hypothetical protein